MFLVCLYEKNRFISELNGKIFRYYYMKNLFFPTEYADRPQQSFRHDIF